MLSLKAIERQRKKLQNKSHTKFMHESATDNFNTLVEKKAYNSNKSKHISCQPLGHIATFKIIRGVPWQVFPCYQIPKISTLV